MSSQAPMPEFADGSLLTDIDTVARWLLQAFEGGWDVARYFPNDGTKPELVLSWEATAADGGLSPTLTYVRKS